MKHTFLSLLAICSILTAKAQISVDNYRAIEQMNWNSNQLLNKNQINQLKAQWTNQNEITMDVNVLMNVEATSYIAIFNVRQIAKSALDVNTMLNARIDTFKKNLAKHGMKENDVVVEIISQVPIYGLRNFKKFFSGSQNEVPIGFELHKNITVVFNTYDKLNDIVFEASKSEIYDLVKVDYFAQNPYHYYDTMRQILTSYIDKIEKQYGKLDIAIDSFERSVSEKTATVNPISRYTKYRGLTRMSYDQLLDKDETLSAPVSTVAAPSMYYDHLPFEEFDLILHPKIIKPSIQYTMNMKIRYTKKQPVRTITKTEVEKQFFMITDNGEIKELRLK